MTANRTLKRDTLKALERAMSHPEFKYCSSSPAAPIIFVFSRDLWRKPTDEQLADYDRRKVIVEANGGRMRSVRWEVAGPNPAFTKDDVEEAIKAVESAHPDLQVYTHWNGAGAYSLSVGAAHAQSQAGGKRRRK